VDRLWPRSLKKEEAHIEELEDPDKKSQIEALLQRARQGTVTLVFAAKDE
jgi:uncharacterized protein YeaO (DUF488 family)